MAHSENTTMGLNASHGNTSGYLTSHSLDEDTCNADNNYIAIIMTVIPLWASLTIIIVLLLVCFHKSLRTIKVYDNCTKETAQHAYHVEIRTGDTSAAYNRRRANLTIDMFDDDQTSMARVVVPGHVIFGRKDTPVQAIDDEKLSELRVTRFWLYRSNKLRKIATIRLTHSSKDPQAKIMVYGLEIRTHDMNKMFFPVMEYISSYGSTSKPNACFDLDTSGSISQLGTGKIETLIFSSDLHLLDYAILVHIFLACTIHLTSLDLLTDSFQTLEVCTYKGLLVGGAAFGLALCLGCLLRFYVKTNYHSRIGIGSWFWIYITTLSLIFFLGTGQWITATITAYQDLCPTVYTNWLISMMVAAAIGSVCCAVVWIIYSVYQVLNPTIGEQYVVPEDVAGTNDPPSKSKKSVRKDQSVNQYQYQTMPMVSQHQQSPAPWQIHGYPIAHLAHPLQPVPPAPYYNGPLVMTPSQTSYKTLQTSYQPSGYDVPPPTMKSSQKNTPVVVAADVANQQPANEHGVSLHGIKPTRRIGSSESTGSHYYNQLMKKKGEVKSISQYGELNKQKKSQSKGNNK